MSFEMLVGLEVTDNAAYTKYRNEMTPLLKQCGGGFKYDFKISEVLKSEVDENINRLFIIYFESEDSMNTFFQHPLYLKIKKVHFENSVKSTTIISSTQSSEQ